MATFTIDLLSGDVFLFSGNFSGSGGTTPTSGATYPQVPTYSLLPSAAANNGKIYVVLAGSGSYVLNRHDAGLYYSNGITWQPLPNIPPYFASNNFQIYDSAVTSKGAMFITSGVTTGVFRKLKIQDSDGTIAYLTDLNTKVDKTTFYTYTGNTLTLINTKAKQSSVATYTGTTAPAIYVSKTSFNTYTGNTLILLNAKLDKTSFVTFTGTTLPANYYTKTQINAYTGATQTLINTKAKQSSVATYTGTTAPASFVGKTQFNTYTGNTVTLIGTKATQSNITIFTGTTLPANYYNKTQINAYTGATNVKINSKQDTLVAGIGITIVGNVISSSGGGSGSTTTTLQLIDLSGGTNVNTIAATPINWTTQVFAGTNLSFTGGTKIYARAAGIYDISYVLNVINADNSTKNIGSVIRKNTSTDITPLSSGSISVDSTNNASTNALPHYLISLNNNDYIELYGFRIGSSGVANTKSNGSWIEVKRIS